MIETKLNTGTGNNKGFELEVEQKQNPFTVALLEFEKTNSYPSFTIGSKVSGTLSSINSKVAMINCKGKNEIQIPMSPNEKAIADTLTIGQAVSVMITSVVDSENYDVYGSLHELKLAELSEFLDKAVRNKTVITGMVKDMSFAGYTVTAYVEDQEISLFMPHLLTDVNKLPDAQSILYTEIEFLLQEVYKDGQKQYLASRKAHLLNKAVGELKRLTIGGGYRGFITGSTDFAIFVQFNECLTGMIHKSNLAPEAADLLDKGEILPGMLIDFWVKDVTKGKLFLTQVMRESLWDNIKTNDILTGKISGIKDFGLMVDLDYETKGLLHKSVLPRGVDTYKKGEHLTVVVTNVNKNNRQITLALK
jgi:ribosomal protein S1